MTACKFEEVFPPRVRDLVAVCDNAYSRAELLAAEADLLLTLDFKISVDSSYTFLELLRLRFGLPDKEFVFARYLLENALLDLYYLRHAAIDLALAAVFLVHKVFKLEWDPEGKELGSIHRDEKMKSAAKDLYLLLNKYD